MMKRLGQGRTEEQIKCNHEVMWTAVRFFAALLYIVFVLELYNYMVKH
jgi:hypothetical protein